MGSHSAGAGVRSAAEGCGARQTVTYAGHTGTVTHVCIDTVKLVSARYGSLGCVSKKQGGCCACGGRGAGAGAGPCCSSGALPICSAARRGRSRCGIASAVSSCGPFTQPTRAGMAWQAAFYSWSMHRKGLTPDWHATGGTAQSRPWPCRGSTSSLPRKRSSASGHSVRG
jgi:hypothetical protein